MSTIDSLATYLNDHLAGSVGALELLDHLAENSTSAGDRQLFQSLQREIEEDQATLKYLLERLAGDESALRKASGWLGAKLAQLKLRLDKSEAHNLQQLEALEVLALGIHGKLSLWLALEAVAPDLPALSSLDLPQLQQRARRQYERVEARRLAAARAAFVAASEG